MNTLPDHVNLKDYGEPSDWMKPYQCFMGRWEGLCKTFSPRGDFVEASAVHMDVYWVDKNTWHLHEDFDRLYSVGPMVFHTDIGVEGKYCFGNSPLVKLEGTMLTAYNYVFTIWSNASGTTVYNNHYFLDANNRRIITHKIGKDGKTNIFQIQDFVRVS
jgi:hypothetical protein